MDTCKTCKHWDEKTIEERDEISYSSYGPRRYCYLLSGKLEDPDEEGVDKKISWENDAEAAAHGIGGARIATGPDFGCIHWSERIEPAQTT